MSPSLNFEIDLVLDLVELMFACLHHIFCFPSWLQAEFGIHRAASKVIATEVHSSLHTCQIFQKQNQSNPPFIGFNIPGRHLKNHIWLSPLELDEDCKALRFSNDISAFTLPSGWKSSGYLAASSSHLKDPHSSPSIPWEPLH